MLKQVCHHKTNVVGSQRSRVADFQGHMSDVRANIEFRIPSERDCSMHSDGNSAR